MGLILVVSEDSVDIETIRGALSVHGWWVTLAGDGEAALQIAADQAPKLVVVDHALPGAHELIRNFGARGGGPGVLVTAPEGSDLSLELAEAGADEVLTKPVSAANVVASVKRCLAAPAPVQPVRAASSVPLMTTNDIFGDVLREVEGEVAGSESAERAMPSAPPEFAPAAPVAGAVAEAAPKPPAAPPERPVVSLAGLFDDETDQVDASPHPAAVAPAAEPQGGGPAPADSEAHIDSLWSSDGSSQSPKAEWDGTERRTDKRPWNSATTSEPFTAESPIGGPVPPEVEETEPPVEQEPLLSSKESEASSAGQIEPVGLDEVNLKGTESVASVLKDEAVAARDDEGSRRSSAFVWAACIAAVLLVAAGIYFALRPDGSPEPNVEPSAAGPAAGESEVVESLEREPAIETEPVEALSAAPAPVVTEAAVRPSAAETESIDEIDLEAIVQQELGKREEELRRVFVEEEKRLLRELRELDEAEPPEQGDGSQDDESDGVGR